MPRDSSTGPDDGVSPDKPRQPGSPDGCLSGNGEKQAKSPTARKAAVVGAEPSHVQAELARLQTLDGSGLRDEWRRRCQAGPPRLSRDLVLRALAYRIQEAAFGGLPKYASHQLAGPVEKADDETAAVLSVADRLTPGMCLVIGGYIRCLFAMRASNSRESPLDR